MQAGGDDMVSCRSTISCNATSDDEVGIMTARECCVENPDGLSYIVSDQTGVQTCTICIGEHLGGSSVCVIIIIMLGSRYTHVKICFGLGLVTALKISHLKLHEPSCNGKIMALYCYYYFILTVFGFFQDFYVGMEQRTGNHLVQVGYQKGAIQVKRNLIFNVHDSPGTASEFIDHQFCSNNN